MKTFILFWNPAISSYTLEQMLSNFSRIRTKRYKHK